MKTSKEMKLKINDEIRDNIEKDRPHCENIEIKLFTGTWSPVNGAIYLDEYEYRVNNTVTINGVDIPKPLRVEDIRDLDKETNYYIVCCASTFYDTVCIRYMNIHKPMFAYLTKEQAIEASKALFGIED